MPPARKNLLIYGAYGYSGKLIAEAALRRGLQPIVAGRDAAKAEALGRKLSLPHRAFSLDDPKAAEKALAGVAVVLNCAGPFAHTATAMLDHCLANGAHYLDITGEWSVIEALAGRDAECQAAGIMAMPSVGADVVPSDCLSLYLAQKLPGAQRLELCIDLFDVPSRGTANSFVESLGKPNMVREGGQLRERRMGADTRQVVIDQKTLSMVGLPWGDIATAWRSTGIPNIAVFIKMVPGTQPFLALAARTGGFWQSAPMQKLFGRLVQKLPEGPNEAARTHGHADFVGTVSDASGHSVRAHLRTPEGYALTAETASEIALRVLGGAAQSGFQTPSRVFGADFILGFAGVSRTDL